MSVVGRVLRWRAIVPFTLVVAAVVVLWYLMADRVVERSVENFGAYLVGARVDVDQADLRLREGTVILRGLHVTNPDKPMTNLVQADEVVAMLAIRPLLEKKIVLDTVALRGMRFGTPREESGAIDNPSEASRQTRAAVNAWANSVRIPPLSLEGLTSAIDVARIAPDSLQTYQLALATLARSDSFRTAWTSRWTALDPRPRVDTARVLVERLRSLNPLQLGIAGATGLVTQSRTTLEALTSIERDLKALDSTTRAGVGELRTAWNSLEAARQADLAYARGLLRLPSLDAPDLSTSVFGASAVQWVEPVLYWVTMAERFVPPGLDPRRRPGPKRNRMAGTSVTFPRGSVYPKFLVRYGEADFALAGTGAAAGSYRAQITGLTTEPAVHGQPLELRAGREAGVSGPRAVAAFARLDHLQSPSRDTIAVSADGIGLPTLDLRMLGARLSLGTGLSSLVLSRTGREIDATWNWRSPGVSWERLAATPLSDTAPMGSREWAESLLWRTVQSVRDVQIGVRLTGTMPSPRISVQSNVGSALAASLRQEVGREIARAEARVRAEVDRLIQQQVTRAETALDGIAADVQQRVGLPLQEVTRAKTQLQEELRRLGRLP